MRKYCFTSPDMSVNKYLPLEYRECYNGYMFVLEGLSMEKRKKFFDWVCSLDDDTFTELADAFNSDDIEKAFIRRNISSLGERFMSQRNMHLLVGDVLISNGMLKELRLLMEWFTINRYNEMHQFVIDDIESYNSIPLWLQFSVFNICYSSRVIRRMKNCKRGPIYYGDLDGEIEYNNYSNICCCKYCLECFMLVREFQLPVSDVAKDIQLMYFKCKEYL